MKSHSISVIDLEHGVVSGEGSADADERFSDIGARSSNLSPGRSAICRKKKFLPLAGMEEN